MTYWRKMLALYEDTIHIVRVIRVIRGGTIRFYCQWDSDSLPLPSSIRHGKFEFPTCLVCIAHPFAWRMLALQQRRIVEFNRAHQVLEDDAR